MEQYIGKISISENDGGAVINSLSVAPVKGSTTREKVITDPASIRLALAGRITWIVDLSHVGFALVKLLTTPSGTVPGTTITDEGKWLMIKAAGNTEIRNASAILPNVDSVDYLRTVFKELKIGKSVKDPYTLSMIARKRFSETSAARSMSGWIENGCLTPEQFHAARTAYRGGYAFNKPGDYGPGVAIDINSLYPWVMVSQKMPVGTAMRCKPDFSELSENNNFFYLLKVNFMLMAKPGAVDFVKKVFGCCVSRETFYKINTWITSIDFQTIKENYDISGEIEEGFRFSTVPGSVIFGDYVLPLYEKKMNLPDGPERASVKLLLNGLSGSFGRSFTNRSLVPRYIGGEIHYFYRSENRSKIPDGYMPIAAAITAYGRERLIHDIQNEGVGKVIYGNTDSMFIRCESPERYIQNNGTDIGTYKVEKVFTRARIIGHCCYFLDDGKSPKCAAPGLSKTAKKTLTPGDYNRFKPGMKFLVDGWKVADDGCKVPAEKIVTIRQGGMEI